MCERRDRHHDHSLLRINHLLRIKWPIFVAETRQPLAWVAFASYSIIITSPIAR